MRWRKGHGLDGMFQLNRSIVAYFEIERDAEKQNKKSIRGRTDVEDSIRFIAL